MWSYCEFISYVQVWFSPSSQVDSSSLCDTSNSAASSSVLTAGLVQPLLSWTLSNNDGSVSGNITKNNKQWQSVQ